MVTADVALSQLTSDGAMQLLGASRIVQSNERPDSSVFVIVNDVEVESPSTSFSEISVGATSRGRTGGEPWNDAACSGPRAPKNGRPRRP